MGKAACSIQFWGMALWQWLDLDSRLPSCAVRNGRQQERLRLQNRTRKIFQQIRLQSVKSRRVYWRRNKKESISVCNKSNFMITRVLFVELIAVLMCWHACEADAAQQPRLPPGIRAEKDIPYVQGGDESQRLDLYLPEQTGE